MNERLQLILACIRVGRANVLTTRDIAKMTNLSIRKVREGIAELRLKFSVPIVASRSLPQGEMKMSYEQISESTYYQNMSYWNQVAQNYRALGGLGICDDETGEELYTI